MKTLYFDCFAGASGNMILGALVALGVDKNELIEALKRLDIADFEIEFTTKDKSGISAIHAEVKVPHEHAHRHLHTIEKIINDSRLDDSVKTRAIKIFTKLANAEAKVHGIGVQKVHFHEVGAMDAIIDVVGCCIGFEMLGIEKFVCSKIHVGSGFVKMAHGKFPVPPPAVAEILQNAPIYSTEIEGELINGLRRGNAGL
jgi:pyridinium-3,5-bisthiocarboxylic acid mononucleotide nickel chelatase